jgi:hypothetical protein
MYKIEDDPFVVDVTTSCLIAVLNGHHISCAIPLHRLRRDGEDVSKPIAFIRNRQVATPEFSCLSFVEV